MIECITIDPRIKVREPKSLLTLPKVVRVGYIDEEAASLFAEDFSLAHQSGQPIIPIVINSLGGDLYSLYSMLDVIESSKVPVATIITGKAMSAGAALFCCGSKDYRFIGPHACIMIHDASSEDAGGKPNEVRVNVEELERLNKLMYSIMERKIGKPKGYLWKLAQKNARADLYLTPEEAVKYKIADHIKVPTFNTVVSVTMELEV